MKSGRGSGYPQAIDRLLESFSSLPGIGRRSAERICFHLLKQPADQVIGLSRAISDLVEKVTCCQVCFNLADASPCPICSNDERDASQVLVVEQVRDLLSFEQTGIYRGVYHVLTGRIDPLGGVEPADLTIAQLRSRLLDASCNARGVQVSEVILGLNPNLEGDATALYLAELLKELPVRVTRLARGVPAGSQLEFASTAVLADAIEGRRAMQQEGQGGGR